MRRASAAWAALILAGCATAPTPPPALEPPPVVTPEPAPTPPPPPAPAPVARTPAAPPRSDIILVSDTSAPSFGAVADAIAAALPPRQYRVTRIAADGAATPIAGQPAAVVAIGAQSVAAARTLAPGAPIVFCQVLAYDEWLAAGAKTWGVQPLPPLELQLKTWKALEPQLRTVAMIVSDASSALAVEARAAAAALATDLVIETSSSDRETLYLFRRLAASVDGLWLLPDNRALSPSALREILSYAAARRIGVLTFNDALLPRGALLSATSVPDDVAMSVLEVLTRVVGGRTTELPTMTPLSAAQIEVNPAVAQSLGLTAPVEIRWVSREPD